MSIRALAVAALILTLAPAPGFAFAAEQRRDALEPGLERIGETLQTVLPAYWKVSGIKIIATVNEGDAVDPKLKQRIEAKVLPVSALYTEAPGTAGKLSPYVIVIETAPADKPRTLYGIAYASYRAGKWSIRIGLENGVDQLGKPIDLIDRPTVVAGSEAAADIAKRLSDAEKLIDEHDKVKQTRSSRFKAEIAALKARHAAAISAEKAGNAAELEALDKEQAKALSHLAKSAEEMRAPLDADLKRIKAEHRAALQKLKTKHILELAKLTDDQAVEKLDAEAQRLSVLADREKAKGEIEKKLQAARAARREADRVARKAAFDALETALKASDVNIRRAAVEAALAQDDETLERIALVRSLESGDWVLQERALLTILSGSPLLALQTVRQKRPGVVATIDVQAMEPESKNFNGYLQWPEGKSRPGKGTVGQGGLTWRDKHCSLSLVLQKNGILTGKGQCDKRSFAAKMRLY